MRLPILPDWTVKSRERPGHHRAVLESRSRRRLRVARLGSERLTAARAAERLALGGVGLPRRADPDPDTPARASARDASGGRDSRPSSRRVASAKALRVEIAPDCMQKPKPGGERSLSRLAQLRRGRGGGDGEAGSGNQGWTRMFTAAHNARSQVWGHSQRGLVPSAACTAFGRRETGACERSTRPTLSGRTSCDAYP